MVVCLMSQSLHYALGTGLFWQSLCLVVLLVVKMYCTIDFSNFHVDINTKMFYNITDKRLYIHQKTKHITKLFS